MSPSPATRHPAILSGVHFMSGDEAIAEGRHRRRLPVLRGLPHHPAVGDRGKARRAASPNRRDVHPDGGRDRCLGRGFGRFLGGNEGHDRHLRPGLLPHDGEPGACGDDGNAVRDRGCAAGRALHRPFPPSSPKGT
jgi:hypothetical protein